MDIPSLFSESASGTLPRSEHVQIRLRPELKQEIEALKDPHKLSWQTLVEQLLEAWVQTHRQMPELRPDATTRPAAPAAPDQRQLAELYALLLAVVDQLAPLVASQGLSLAAAAGRVSFTTRRDCSARALGERLAHGALSKMSAYLDAAQGWDAGMLSALQESPMVEASPACPPPRRVSVPTSGGARWCPYGRGTG